MSRTGKQKHEGGRSRSRGTGQGKGGRRRDAGTGSSAGGGGRGKKRRGSFQWRERGTFHGHGLFVEGGDLGEWGPSGSPLQEPHRRVQRGADGVRRNAQDPTSAFDLLSERESRNFKAVNYYYPRPEDVSMETTDMSMQEQSAQSELPAFPYSTHLPASRMHSTDLMEKSNTVQDVEIFAGKDMPGFSSTSLKEEAIFTPQNVRTQKVSPLRPRASSTTHSSESFHKKATSTGDQEVKRPLKQGFLGPRRGTSRTGNHGKAQSSGFSSRSYNAPLFTSCLAESYEDSIESEVLETSDVDEELAEDYVSNLAGEISLELLEAEMSLRDVSLAQTPIDSMMINSHNTNISENLTYSCASSAEENDDFESSTVKTNRKAADKNVVSGQTNFRKLMKMGEDIESGFLAGRIVIEEGSGYSSEEEDSPEEDCLLKEESRLRYLALDDSLEEDSDEEDEMDRLIQESEGPSMLESKASAKKLGQHRKSAQREQGALRSKKLPKTPFPGQKKRQRKETIAAKRRDRALHRGVDFEAINETLQQLVEDGDIFAFEPMNNQDRSLVHKLASVYRLKSTSQGSGRKRFVVVTRTQHTCLPSGDDETRLFKLLGRDDAEAGTFQVMKISGYGERHRLVKKHRRAGRQAWQSLKQSKSEGALSKISGFKKSELAAKRSLHSKKSGAGAVSRLSSSPVCFVSCGTVGPDDSVDFGALQKVGPVEAFVDMESHQSGENSSTKRSQLTSKASCNEFGQFEAHTKAFGSRLMAKMGFVEGHGLGRDGQGITQPVIAIQRPRTLGLGA